MPDAAVAAADIVLGFDYGRKTTGVAVGGALTGAARPLAAMRGDLQAQLNAAEKLIREWKPRRLVVGVPFHLDGASHATTKQARRFAAALAGRAGLPTDAADERLTTDAARRQMKAQTARQRRRSFAETGASSVHANAAAEILQAWLDRRRRETGDGNQALAA